MVSKNRLEVCPKKLSLQELTNELKIQGINCGN
jgi:hypothetical protein